MTTLAPAARTQDDDRALRPKTLAEYHGQDGVRTNLAVYIRSARERGAVLDHVLLAGPPGLGKTTMAEVVANELGARIVTVHGPTLKTKGELASILMTLRRGDVLFIDEIHALGTKVAEILYPATEDFKLEVVAGNQALTLKIEPFTLVGATTSAGKLPRPLRDRFGIVCEMQPYTVPQLVEIVLSSARKLGVSLSEDGATELARRSRGTPRLANRMLRRVQDFSHAMSRPADGALVALTCERVGVDTAGLDKTGRRYLQVLADKSVPVALTTMVSLLGEAKDVVEDFVEPYLMAVGFVEKTPKGRVVTAAGRAHLGRAAA